MRKYEKVINVFRGRDNPNSIKQPNLDNCVNMLHYSRWCERFIKLALYLADRAISWVSRS